MCSVTRQPYQMDVLSGMWCEMVKKKKKDVRRKKKRSGRSGGTSRHLTIYESTGSAKGGR